MIIDTAEVQQTLLRSLHYQIYPDFPIHKMSIQALFFFSFTIQRFLNLSIDLLDTAYYVA